ncbi:MAG TPA: O-acetyl-ADP-ribose deacetylase [Cerasibacillus sp.]|uniref:O-acetyl-ADP-ribose deacetylase n=1 Tax=Cerasibacillus sp. TaxID=2498711 RepID=UPI002F421266
MHVEINGNELILMTGDLTKQKTDAIVNAANGTLMGGGGVDGAIHNVAGPELLKECKQIREHQLNGKYLPTGEVVITKGYDLPAKYVIHTVGPIWSQSKSNQDELLAKCYRNSLQLALDKELTSIAFPSISTGAYRFPIELAATIAMRTIIDFLKSHLFGQVIMTLFSEEDYDAYIHAYGNSIGQ